MAARRSRAKAGSVKVNFKDVESRKTPPEGDYLLDVLEAKLGESSAKNEQIEFVLEVAGGEYKGTKLWFYCPLQENSLWKLHAFLTALGEDVPQDEMDVDLSELVGKQVVGVLTHETYQGRKRAKMTDFDSVENYNGDDLQGSDDKKGKKSKKDKGAKDDDAKADKKGGKGKSKGDDKKSKKPKVEKVSESDVKDMDEDELKAIVKKHKLDVDLKSIKKLGKQQAAVVTALEEADLLDD